MATKRINMSGKDDPENKLVLQKMKNIIALSGRTTHDVNCRTGKGRCFLTSILNNGSSVKLAHVALLARVLRVDPLYLLDHNLDASTENIIRAQNEYFLTWACSLGALERKQIMTIHEELHGGAVDVDIDVDIDVDDEEEE